MAGWHHWLNGRESEWTLGVGDGQGGLASCNPWRRKESDTTVRLNWTELNTKNVVSIQLCVLLTWIYKWTNSHMCLTAKRYLDVFCLSLALLSVWNAGYSYFLTEYRKNCNLNISSQFNSVQSISPVWHFATPWTAARQASLSIINSQSLLKLMSIELVMPSSHLILCCPLLLLPSIFPSIRVFSNESALCIRWPNYWSFSFNISPTNEHPGLSPLGWTGWISLQSSGISRVLSYTTVQ